MNFIVITIALVAAPLLAASVQTGCILAMDPKYDTVQSQDNMTDERYSGRGHKGKRAGEDLSSKESGARKKGAAPPEKRPRLKYRDEPKCAC